MAMDEIQKYIKYDESRFSSSISMSQSDAEFFVNLTQNTSNDVSNAKYYRQAQNLLNQGADVREVQKNVQNFRNFIECSEYCKRK